MLTSKYNKLEIKILKSLRKKIKTIEEKINEIKETNPFLIPLALTSVFFGVPLLLARRAPAAIAAAYRAQLAIVWAGLAATAGKDPS